MNSEEHRELDDAVSSIQSKYLKNLSSKIECFERLLIRIENNNEVSSALIEIKENSHRIYGIGATLGFERLGEIARRVEATAAELSQATSNRENLRRLVLLVEEMLDHMKHLQQPFL
ncbi:Hpt domain-containing protein [uncultured Aliiroseovarius sp.]|uniref:Hpt domain-containing protein n=1 Tax=uncultured Aliiroseovarius sp. TaxID=1658783 RepID=UPI00259812B9|nr:Hpt domain-containing protein [uncultured Aliiroseovarius sp.]